MKNALISITMGVALTFAGIPAIGAVPLQGGGLEGETTDYSPVDQARWFCANRASGRFLHWGRCGGGPTYRVYCRNRYTGRFLHWGYC